MKIALLHYHLNPGGVTTVIRHQVQALKKDCSLLVLSGMPPGSPWPVPCKSIPDVGYPNDPPSAPDPEKAAQDILTAIREEWIDGCDLLHVHNPTLAKNPMFLGVLKALQEKGVTLFLQIHDFAEDGRPLAYFQDTYPRDCHYGVINSRDHRLLLDAGLKHDGLHLLPNPVKPLSTVKSPSSAREEILYPVRAIRRKNIGEALLLSLFIKREQMLSITLPPNSMADMSAYNGWKRFSQKNKLKDSRSFATDGYINTIWR